MRSSNRLIGALSLAVLSLVFCLPVRAQEEAKPAAPVDPEVEQTSRLVDEIKKEVETVRGLLFKEDIARKVFSSDDIRKLTTEMMERDMPPEKMRQMSAVSARLGFFPPGLDIAEALSDLLAEGAAGFYDPETKTLFALRGFSPEGAKPIIFHELIHALEDQHFDLGKLLKDTLDATDKAMAIRAVVEGSATLYMIQYVQAHPELAMAMVRDAMKQMQNQTKVMAKLPVYLSVMMGIFPYMSGLEFVQATTAGDAERLAGLYANLPASSEQILHRAKYGFKGDYPVGIRMPDFAGVLPEGYAKIHEDKIGELGVAILLNEFLGDTNRAKLSRITAPMQSGVMIRGGVKAASEGWDGDLVVGFEGPLGAVGLVWASRWDSEKDASEFAKRYEAGLAYKWDTLKLLPKTAKIEVRGDRVMIVEGFPEASMADLAAHAWAGVRFLPDLRDPSDLRAFRKPATRD